MRRAILMCAGEYEPIPIPVGKKHKSLRSAEAFEYCGEEPLVIAVDGGLPRLLAQGIMPDLVLGDFDSLEKKFGPYLDEFEAAHPGCLFRLPCEKDDTDTVFAAKMCLQRGCRELLFYGALGGRLDHTFANLQTLSWLKKQGACGYLIGKTTLAAVISEETVLLPADYEGTFSLFALDKEVTGVTLEGMKYPLSEASVSNTFPIGVSNEVNAETLRESGRTRALVTIRTGTALMILEKSESARLRLEKRLQEENREQNTELNRDEDAPAEYKKENRAGFPAEDTEQNRAGFPAEDTEQNRADGPAEDTEQNRADGPAEDRKENGADGFSEDRRAGKSPAQRMPDPSMLERIPLKH